MVDQQLDRLVVLKLPQLLKHQIDILELELVWAAQFEHESKHVG